MDPIQGEGLRMKIDKGLIAMIIIVLLIIAWASYVYMIFIESHNEDNAKNALCQSLGYDRLTGFEEKLKGRVYIRCTGTNMVKGEIIRNTSKWLWWGFDP